MSEVCRPSICSHSLGRAWLHDLPGKIRAAADAGFAGLEIFYEDLKYHAASLYNTQTPTHAQELAAARDIRSLCSSHGLEIINLQPLRDIEGRLDPVARAAAEGEVYHAVDLAHALGTDLIGIASSLLPTSEVSDHFEQLAADLAAVADIGAAAKPPVRFTYEALCFGTRISSWQQSRDLVRRAARPNLGLCIDTFNLAGWDFADPTEANGERLDGRARLTQSLAELRATVRREEIFYVQVVDAERLAQPLDEQHPQYVNNQPARMTWSRASRLFYGEKSKGAYLPVTDIMKILIEDLCWRGWVSMEFFNRSLEGPSSTTPDEHATRGIESWRRMVADIPPLLNKRRLLPKSSGQTSCNGFSGNAQASLQLARL